MYRSLYPETKLATNTVTGWDERIMSVTVSPALLLDWVSNTLQDELHPTETLEFAEALQKLIEQYLLEQGADLLVAGGEVAPREEVAS